MAHAGSGQVKGRVRTMALWIAGRALGELTASLPPGDSQEAKRLSAAGTLGMYSNADEHVTRSNPAAPRRSASATSSPITSPRISVTLVSPRAATFSSACAADRQHGSRGQRAVKCAHCSSWMRTQTTMRPQQFRWLEPQRVQNPDSSASMSPERAQPLSSSSSCPWQGRRPATTGFMTSDQCWANWHRLSYPRTQASVQPQSVLEAHRACNNNCGDAAGLATVLNRSRPCTTGHVGHTCLSISADRSTPTTRPDGPTAAAASSKTRPVPQATSSATMPGRGAANSSSRRANGGWYLDAQGARASAESVVCGLSPVPTRRDVHHTRKARSPVCCCRSSCSRSAWRRVYIYVCVGITASLAKPAAAASAQLRHCADTGEHTHAWCLRVHDQACRGNMKEGTQSAHRSSTS